MYWRARYLRIGFLFAVAKKQNLASYRKTVRAFVSNNRPVAELLPVQERPSARMDKMIAARVMEAYTSLFLTPKQDDGSRYSVINEDWGLRRSPARTAIRQFPQN
jgi:hypothetical protein